MDAAYADPQYALAILLDGQGKLKDAKRYYQAYVDLTASQTEDDTIRYAKSRLSELKTP